MAIKSSQQPPQSIKQQQTTQPQQTKPHHRYIKKQEKRIFSPQYWLIFILISFFKFFSVNLYYSTDFEVHRHWLSITNHLHPREWYYDVSSEHTFDYPPLFAFGQYVLSQLAITLFGQFDPLITSLEHHDYASTWTIWFQHLTVIGTDIVLFWAILKCLDVLFPLYLESNPQQNIPNPSQSTTSQLLPSTHQITSSTQQTQRNWSLILLLLIFCCPTLFLVDHIHFQYNGFLLGLFLLVLAHHFEGIDRQFVLNSYKYQSNVALYSKKRSFLSKIFTWEPMHPHYKGAITFTCLLWFKHIFAYAVPGYTLFLLITFVWDYNQFTFDKEQLKNESKETKDLNSSSLQSLSSITMPSKRLHITRLIKLGLIVLSLSSLIILPLMLLQPPTNITTHQAEKAGYLLTHISQDSSHPNNQLYMMTMASTGLKRVDRIEKEKEYHTMLKRYDFQIDQDSSISPLHRPGWTGDVLNWSPIDQNIEKMVQHDIISTCYFDYFVSFLQQIIISDYLIIGTYNPNGIYPSERIFSSDVINYEEYLLDHQLQAILNTTTTSHQATKQPIILPQGSSYGTLIRKIAQKIPIGIRKAIMGFVEGIPKVFPNLFENSTRLEPLLNQLSIFLLNDIKSITHMINIEQRDVEIVIDDSMLSNIITTTIQSLKLNLTQLKSRLFPFRRGLIHSYWASNWYSLYSFVDFFVAKGIKSGFFETLIKKSPFLEKIINKVPYLANLPHRLALTTELWELSHAENADIDMNQFSQRRDVAMNLISLSPSDLNCHVPAPCSRSLPLLVGVTSGLVGETQFQILPRITSPKAMLLTLGMTLVGLFLIFFRLFENEIPMQDQKSTKQITTTTTFPHQYQYTPRHKRQLQLIYAVSWSTLSSFLCGWHVHEKAILLIIIPFSLTIIIDIAAAFKTTPSQQIDTNNTINNNGYRYLQMEHFNILSSLAVVGIVTLIPLFPNKSLEQIITVLFLIAYIGIHFTIISKTNSFNTELDLYRLATKPGSIREIEINRQTFLPTSFFNRLLSCLPILTSFITLGVITPAYFIVLYCFPAFSFLPSIIVSIISATILIGFITPLMLFKMISLHNEAL